MTAANPYQRLIRPVLAWGRMLGATAFAAIFVSSLGLIAQILLYRALPVADAGQFAVVISVMETLVAFSRFGQTSVIVRAYSQHPPATFDWQRDLGGTIGFVSPLILGGLLISLVVYRFAIPLIIFIVFSSTLRLVIQYMFSMMVGNRRYAWANALLRLPNALLLIAAAAMLIEPRLATLGTSLGWFAICIVVTGVIGTAVLMRYAARGTQTLLLTQRWQGLTFVASGATNSLPDEGLISIAGVLLPSGDLAGVGALSVLISPYSLLQSVLAQMLMSENARRRADSLWLQIGALWLFVALISVPVLLLAPIAIRLVYAGRYDSVLSLIPLFVLPGALRLTETLPRAYLMGRADTALLNRFAAMQVVIGLAGVALAVLLIAPLGIAGIGLTAAAIFGARNVVSYAMLAYMRRSNL